jgi:adenine deaminase
MLRVEAKGRHIRVMEAYEGQLMTGSRVMEARVEEGQVMSDTHRDLLKLLVMNRYSPTAPSIGFVSGFGLKRGALASTVAHDSHNIIALGVDDESLVRAVNLLIEAKGGIAAVDLVSGDFLGAQKLESFLPLPITGIMSADDGYEVARAYSQLDQMAKDFGSKLQAPFMTLSFMALLVIPELKLSDKGLFDGKSFSFTSLFV